MNSIKETANRIVQHVPIFFRNYLNMVIRKVQGLHEEPEPFILAGCESSGTSKEAIDMCGRKINTWSGRFSQVFQKTILAKSLPSGRIEEDPKRVQEENTGVRFHD